MKISRYDWILIAVFFTAINLIFLWGIDISVSAMIVNGVVTNGFIERNPAVIYHICLYGEILINIGLVFVLVHFINKMEK